MILGDIGNALHVIGNESGAGSLKVALRLSRDRVLVNEDPISCGPAPATNDLRVWRSTRENFLRGMYIGWPDFSFDQCTDHGLLMNADRLGQESLVIVWVGCGLSEQLLLAWVIFLFDQMTVDTSKLQIVQFESLSPNQRILGMGELSPDNIRQFRPEPRRLNSEEIRELRRVWHIFTSSDPTVLATYVAKTSPMPLLHQAVCQLVYRYPCIRSGLGIWDEKLLHYVAEKGPAATRIIGYTMGYNKTVDQVGDFYLFQRLIDLGNVALASPLISISGNARNMRECDVKLTSFGEKVLAGKANNVEENGIDDWVGGVHLSSERSVTFRDGGNLLLPA